MFVQISCNSKKANLLNQKLVMSTLLQRSVENPPPMAHCLSIGAEVNGVVLIAFSASRFLKLNANAASRPSIIFRQKLVG
jgi:microcompartment protein CcmK/EutM